MVEPVPILAMAITVLAHLVSLVLAVSMMRTIHAPLDCPAGMEPPVCLETLLTSPVHVFLSSVGTFVKSGFSPLLKQVHESLTQRFLAHTSLSSPLQGSSRVSALWTWWEYQWGLLPQ